MFTYVIVALIMFIVGRLTAAYVPEFCDIVLWLYKKTVLVLLVVLLSIWRIVFGFGILIPMIITAVLFHLSKVIVACSDWSLTKLIALEELLRKQSEEACENALRDLRA